MKAAREQGREPVVAVFSGTSEGRVLCERLCAAGLPVRAFVATEYGRVVAGSAAGMEVRSGRLDAHGMARALRGCALVVDATHPYAAAASANIARAAHEAGLELLRLVRPALPAGEQAVFADDMQHAARFLASREGNVLSTCGSSSVGCLAAQPGLCERLYVRTLPSAEALAACQRAGIAPARIICMQGPFSHELNCALLRFADAKWLLTKDSGAAGGFMQKVTAAEHVHARLVVVARPLPHEEGLELDELLCAVLARLSP